MSVRRLPPSLYQMGDLYYRSGEGWMEIFSLKPSIPFADTDDEPRELVVPPALPDFDSPSTSHRLMTQLPEMEAPLVHWVTRSGGRIHRKAVRTGGFPKGVMLGAVVGRAYCCGQLLIGMVNTQDRVCCVAYEKLVFEVMRYEVMVLERGDVEWVACRNGYVPPSALPGGMTLQSDHVYPARVNIHGVQVPGQIIKGERSARVPFDKHELQFREYDVLILRCEGDERPRSTIRMGPTDQEWDEFLEPKSPKQLESPRRGKRDYTGAPIRRVCLPPLETSEGESSSAGTKAPPAGEDVPGPSQPMESPGTEASECHSSPKRFQPIARPRL